MLVQIRHLKYLKAATGSKQILGYLNGSDRPLCDIQDLKCMAANWLIAANDLTLVKNPAGFYLL
jgi:hypothetical protein